MAIQEVNQSGYAWVEGIDSRTRLPDHFLVPAEPHGSAREVNPFSETWLPAAVVWLVGLLGRPNPQPSPLAWSSNGGLAAHVAHRAQTGQARSPLDRYRAGVEIFSEHFGGLGAPAQARFETEDGAELIGEPLGRWLGETILYERIAGVLLRLPAVVESARDGDEGMLRELHAECVRSAREPTMNQRWLVDEDPDRVVLSYGNGWELSPSDTAPASDLEYEVRALVSAIIGRCLEGQLSGALALVADDSARPGHELIITADSLSACLWMQLAQVAAKKVVPRRCAYPGCRGWFLIGSDRTERAEYCSPRCNQAMKRYRDKQQAFDLHQSGMPLDRISERFGIRQNTARKWIREIEGGEAGNDD